MTNGVGVLPRWIERLPKGEKVLVCGQNASGKTTVVNNIALQMIRAGKKVGIIANSLYFSVTRILSSELKHSSYIDLLKSGDTEQLTTIVDKSVVVDPDSYELHKGYLDSADLIIVADVPECESEEQEIEFLNNIKVGANQLILFDHWMSYSASQTINFRKLVVSKVSSDDESLVINIHFEGESEILTLRDK